MTEKQLFKKQTKDKEKKKLNKKLFHEFKKEYGENPIDITIISILLSHNWAIV